MFDDTAKQKYDTYQVILLLQFDAF